MIEALCPLIHLAHHSLKKLVEDSFYTVIIGKRDHGFTLMIRLVSRREPQRRTRSSLRSKPGCGSNQI
jgi:4-hydroxy-3-methylbut-2-enyl diphosphate reductase IspH